MQKRRHRRLTVDQGLVDVDVEYVGAAFCLLPGDGRANRGEPVMLVRSPMTMKLEAVVMEELLR